MRHAASALCSDGSGLAPRQGSGRLHARLPLGAGTEPSAGSVYSKTTAQAEGHTPCAFTAGADVDVGSPGCVDHKSNVVSLKSIPFLHIARVRCQCPPSSSEKASQALLVEGYGGQLTGVYRYLRITISVSAPPMGSPHTGTTAQRGRGRGRGSSNGARQESPLTTPPPSSFSEKACSGCASTSCC